MSQIVNRLILRKEIKKEIVHRFHRFISNKIIKIKKVHGLILIKEIKKEIVHRLRRFTLIFFIK